VRYRGAELDGAPESRATAAHLASYAPGMQPLYHVSSTANRESIAANGLDWTRMGAAPGIAGSAEPEVAGVFLCDEDEVGFFQHINNTGGPVDVWAVTGIAADDLIDNGSGFSYLPARIPAAQVTLISCAQAEKYH
jgi:hypothetical protein